MDTQSADTHAQKSKIEEDPQTSQERNQNRPVDAGRQETDPRWKSIEKRVRRIIYWFERGAPQTRKRLLVELLGGLVGTVSLAAGLGLFIIFFPVLLLENFYPNQWCNRLVRIPVMLTAIGIASLGFVTTGLRGSSDQSPRTASHMADGAQSMPGTRGTRMPTHRGTAGKSPPRKSVINAGHEWGCIECKTTVYSVSRPRTCPRCARSEGDLPTGVDLFTPNDSE